VSAAIEARDVFRVYSTPEGDSVALQGLNLAVEESEVVVVLGPSGSGKSTLLRILAGLDRPSAGSVRVFGSDLGRLGERALAAYRAGTLGYVDQHYSRSLDPDLTARELVALQLGLDGLPPDSRLRRSDELLERVGLADRGGARPRELSGGEQQRVAVCAALGHRPRLLLADEPTGELDPESAARVYDLIGELTRERGCTTVVVSHDEESTAIADRVVRVRDGRVSGEAAGGGEEAIVVGRGGWLRLPEDVLARAGIRSHATARLAEGGVLVSALDGGAASEDAGTPTETARVQDVAASDGRGEGPIAELRSIRKILGAGADRRELFDGLNAAFEAGRFAVVTGPSGSGKTTLLHLLAGLDDPTEGEIVVSATPLAALDRAERAAFRRANVAFVRQQADVTPFLSARENVELTLAIRDVPARDAAARADDALRSVGLAERIEQRASRLSAGERQRVAIARALATDAPLLLADEPTARLDEANALAVGSLFARLAREHGVAIVCATHDPLLVEQADAELPLGRLGAGASPLPGEEDPRREGRARSGPGSRLR
jgi:ABC-type lipoprotein export system ATPase subunit